jgi:iron complex outermembrane receptor protein
MKIFLSFTLLLIACISIYSQENGYNLPDVVVTAGRTPVYFNELTRCVEIITSEDLQNMPVSGINDVLQYAAGVDVRQRGTEGVQADISIRGGSSEQTLIMVDGVKMSDPQTGHHNMSLPVSLNDIERIEILKGQGAKSFGANAFSGVINIITKKNKSNNVNMHALGGQNGLYELGLGTSYTTGNFNNNISINRKKSDGYRYNTAFNQYDVNYNSSLQLGNNRINILAGHIDNEFGANGFYTSSPEQWEHLITTMASANAEIHSGIFTITPKISWRKNKDRYLLNYKIPSLYENNHKTNVFNYELQLSASTAAGITSVGAELTQDKIESSNLGDHSRKTYGVFAEQKVVLWNNLNLSAGLFAYDYPVIGWKYWPGIDFSYIMEGGFRIYGSAGKAFRIPSFTDLYYKGGGSEGNPGLKHEETTNYEAGLFWAQKTLTCNLSLFRKEGKNIIDWFYIPENGVWKADNTSKITTNGAEVNLDFYPAKNDFIYQLGINYTYLDISKETKSLLSRYMPDHLRHQAVLNIGNYLPFNIKQSWMLRYEDRMNSSDNFIVDSRIGYKVSAFEIFLKASNLFNKSYRDMQLIPLPGRWISAGVTMTIDY